MADDCRSSRFVAIKQAQRFMAGVIKPGRPPPEATPLLPATLVRSERRQSPLRRTPGGYLLIASPAAFAGPMTE